MEDHGSWKNTLRLFQRHCESGGEGSLNVKTESDGSRRIEVCLKLPASISVVHSARRKKPPSRIRRDLERRRAWLEKRESSGRTHHQQQAANSEVMADRPSVIASCGVTATSVNIGEPALVPISFEDYPKDVVDKE